MRLACSAAPAAVQSHSRVHSGGQTSPWSDITLAKASRRSNGVCRWVIEAGTVPAYPISRWPSSMA